MRIISNIIVRFGYVVLPLLLLAFGLAWSIYMVFGTPVPLKQALKQSGLYGSIVQNTVDDKQQEIATTLPLDRPEIKTALQQAFPPQLIEANATRVIESTYDWMQGRTSTLTLRVDLSDARESFARSVRDYVVNRTAGLPICSLAELRAIGSINAINPFDATCRPAQITPAAAGELAYQEVITNQALGNTVFTTDSIRNANGTTLSEQLKPVPQVYAAITTILYGTGIGTVVCIATIVLIRRKQWRQTTKRLAGILFSAGLLSGGMALVIGLGFKTIALAIAKSAQSEFIQAKIVFTVTHLAETFQRWWLGYSVALIAIAIILWIIRIIIPKPPQESQHTSSGMSTTLPPIAPRDTNVRL